MAQCMPTANAACPLTIPPLETPSEREVQSARGPLVFTRNDFEPGSGRDLAQPEWYPQMPVRGGVRPLRIRAAGPHLYDV